MRTLASLNPSKSALNVVDDYDLIRKSFFLSGRFDEGFLFRTFKAYDRLIIDHFYHDVYLVNSVLLISSAKEYWKGLILHYRCFWAWSDLEFEKAIRFIDTIEYMDTVTFPSALLSDLPSWLRLMVLLYSLRCIKRKRVASRGNFLSKPCRVSYIEAMNSWRWEPPEWSSFLIPISLQ